MLKQKLFYTAAVFALALATPAAAQMIQDGLPQMYAQGGPGALSPQEIVPILRSRGLDPLSPPARRGPNYVMRAVDEDGREVRVVVDAFYGDVVSVRPTMSASRLPPGGSVGPYEPMRAPPGRYEAEPEPRAAYRPGPPGYESDRPLSRPPGAVPSGPQGRYSAAPSADPREPADRQVPSDPQVIMAPPESGRNGGLLPPPPERFPQRVAPGADQKAKPPQSPRRAAAATSRPSDPPLPKPRPAAPPSAPAAAATPDADASPMPPPIPDPSDPIPH